MTTFTGSEYFFAKGEVARVVGRHAHHHPGAVVGQDVVGDPERDLLAVERVRDVFAEKTPSFSPSMVRSRSDFWLAL
jgi:hypothetical protein